MDEAQLTHRIESYVSILDQRRRIDEASKLLKMQEEKLEEELWLFMESMGVTSVKTEKWGLVTRTHRHDPYVVDMGEFHEWCMVTDNVHLLREEVKRQMLRDFISERLKAGDPDYCPPGIEYKLTNKIHIKGRPKDGEAE
jgi:hypothetical protein